MTYLILKDTFGAYTTPRPALRHIISYARDVLEEVNR